MNAGQMQGTLDVIAWKRDKTQAHTARVLQTGLQLRQRGIDRFTADDVASDDLDDRSRNVIGSTFTILGNAKHALIEPVMFQTDEGLRPLTRPSQKSQGNGNQLRVWRVRVPEAVLWLRKHGYDVPEAGNQIELLVAISGISR